MLLYVVRSQVDRLISTGFVLKDTDGRALALTSIEPIVAHKPLRLLDDGHEVLAYPAVDLCTVLRIKVIVANDGEHNTLLSWNFRLQLYFCAKRYVRRPLVSTPNRRIPRA